MSRPLIAYDATSVPPQPAGAGAYTLNLLRALVRLDTEHDYVVYGRSHVLPLLGQMPANVTVSDVGALSRARRLFWEQVSLPLDLRQRKAALLHSPHHTTPLLYCPCPRVLTVHDVTFFIVPERYPLSRRLYFQVLTLLAARRSARVLVPSASVKDDARIFLRLPPERADVTAEGVDLSFRPADAAAVAAVREKYGLPAGYLLSLGTREPGKNRTALFHAMRRLLDEGRDVHLAVAGQAGWKTDEEQAALDTVGLRGLVRFTGYVAQEDLPALYSGARVFVFPSLYEGFGLPVLEAMACGVPVVTSNVSAMPEVAGDAALLVDPHDDGAIADAVGRLLDDESLTAKLARAGVERASAFTWDECARKTLAAYSAVLGEQR